MGEQADYLIDQMMDHPEDEYDYEPDAPAFKTCRCCGVDDLCWGQVGAKWRLFDQRGQIHVCSKNPLRETPNLGAPNRETLEPPVGFKVRS